MFRVSILQQYKKRYSIPLANDVGGIVQANLWWYRSLSFGNINVFGNALERVQQQAEELSRINVNNAKTIANTAKETAAEFSANRQREVYR